jgi:glycosyltransferase involved in cell wall biosynthesis
MLASAIRHPPKRGQPLIVAMDVQNLGITGIGAYTRSLVGELARRPDVILKPYGWIANRKVIGGLGSRLHARTARFDLPLPRAHVAHHPDHAFPSGVQHPRRIVTVHDISFALFPKDYASAHVDYFVRAMGRQVEQNVDFICDSTSTQDGLIEQFGAARDRCNVVPLGLSGEWFAVGREKEYAALRTRFTLARPYLLHVGAWVPRKRLSNVLAAYTIYVQRSADPVDLVLVGPDARAWHGGEADKVALLLDAPLMRDRVHVLGELPDVSVLALFDGAAAYVTASRWEGFGLTVLQAMARGVPVVAPRHSSLPELAGEHAYWVGPECDPDEMSIQISRALEADVETRSSAKVAASAFTSRRMSEGTIAAYLKSAHRAIEQ